jgi:D-aminoacyl-tRNA deacylase
MRVVVQRVSSASVLVDGETIGAIGAGLALFVGLEKDDDEATLAWMSEKIVGLRVFEDAAGKMNLDLASAGASILAVPNFTVAGSCAKGRRPSFDSAMEPRSASGMFDGFVERLRRLGAPVETGRFGAEMGATLTSDGPVTFVIERRP